jgi:hypothetical protein
MLHLARCLTTTLKKCTLVFTYKGATAIRAFCHMESRAEPKVQGKKKEEYLLFVKLRYTIIRMAQTHSNECYFILDIGKQMLETSYILSLGQLLKIVLELKKYLWQKLKPKKT